MPLICRVTPYANVHACAHAKAAYLHEGTPIFVNDRELLCALWSGKQKPPNKQVNWCCERGLNSRPLPYQGSALPLSYRSAGFEACARRSGATFATGRGRAQAVCVVKTASVTVILAAASSASSSGALVHAAFRVCRPMFGGLSGLTARHGPLSSVLCRLSIRRAKKPCRKGTS